MGAKLVVDVGSFGSVTLIWEKSGLYFLRTAFSWRSKEFSDSKAEILFFKVISSSVIADLNSASEKES